MAANRASPSLPSALICCFRTDAIIRFSLACFFRLDDATPFFFQFSVREGEDSIINVSTEESEH